MKVFAEIEAQRRQAEKMKLAAKKRERSMNDEEQTKLKEEMKFNKEFKAEGRQQARVDNWRDMANGGKKKKQKKKIDSLKIFEVLKIRFTNINRCCRSSPPAWA